MKQNLMSSLFELQRIEIAGIESKDSHGFRAQESITLGNCSSQTQDLRISR